MRAEWYDGRTSFVIDLLVMSHACIVGTNRAVYREFRRRGVTVEIVVPSLMELGRVATTPEPVLTDDPPLHMSPVTNGDLRLMRYIRLPELMASRRPRNVLMENDPASLAVLHASLHRPKGAMLACISCENVFRSPKADWIAGGPTKAFKTVLIRTLHRIARSRVDRVFVISKEGCEVMERLGYAKRVTQIPLGFDPDLFRPDNVAHAESRRQLGLTGLVIAYFGRVIPQKGLHLLVEALAGLKEYPWQLLIDRFMDEQDEYASRVDTLLDEYGIRERIVYFHARHDEMPRFVRAADIVVVPSLQYPYWKEQYGRVVAESMACGKALIVSDSGALPEVLGGAGVVVRQGDIVGLRDALRLLIEDPLRRERLGERARARANEALSIPVQVDVMTAVLK